MIYNWSVFSIYQTWTWKKVLVSKLL